MTNPNPTTGKPPRGSNTPTHNPSFSGRKRTSSNVSSKTRALRGSTGLTRKQEDRIRARLKQLAEEHHGEDWFGITDTDYNALCRATAFKLRKDGLHVTTKQVRDASKRMRNTPEIRTEHPVSMEQDAYEHVQHLAEGAGLPMKAIVSAIIREHRDQHA